MSNSHDIKNTLCVSDAQVAGKKILLRKLRLLGKVFLARSNLKSERVCNEHFVLAKKWEEHDASYAQKMTSCAKSHYFFQIYDTVSTSKQACF